MSRPCRVAAHEMPLGAVQPEWLQASYAWGETLGRGTAKSRTLLSWQQWMCSISCSPALFRLWRCRRIGMGNTGREGLAGPHQRLWRFWRHRRLAGREKARLRRYSSLVSHMCCEHASGSCSAVHRARVAACAPRGRVLPLPSVSTFCGWQIDETAPGRQVVQLGVATHQGGGGRGLGGVVSGPVAVQGDCQRLCVRQGGQGCLGCLEDVQEEGAQRLKSHNAQLPAG